MKMICALLLLGMLQGASINRPEDIKEEEIKNLWLACELDSVIPLTVFEQAIKGYNQIENIQKKNLITFIDYSKPSIEERFFVIDIKSKKLLYQTLVAHGKNSGWNEVSSFSNEPRSLKSCLGFFLTAETYFGKHGYSLRLDGLEDNINDNARARSIVIHGADYVSHEFAKKYGRLGRSWGCPALPVDQTKEIINTIANGSCLFIYADDTYYLENSEFL